MIMHREKTLQLPTACLALTTVTAAALSEVTATARLTPEILCEQGKKIALNFTASLQETTDGRGEMSTAL